MVIPTPNQGIPEQQGADPANLPGAQVSWDGVMENRLWQRYTNAADRTARHGVGVVENEVSALQAEDRAEIYDGVNWVSQRARSAFAYLMRNTDAAAINNSTVLVSDGVMTLTLPAAASFTIRGTIVYDSSAAADFKVATVWPAGSSGKIWYDGLATTTVGIVGSAQYAVATASATTFAFGGAAVGTLTFLNFYGRITTVGAGTFTVQYAQQTADPTNTTVRQDSYLEVVRRS